MKFDRMTLQSLVRLLACATAIAIASSLPAKAFGTKNEVAVHYHDLKISQPGGATVLLARLKRAAREVCGGEPGSIDLHLQAIFQTCVQDAVGRAVDTVGEPMVSQLYWHPDMQLLADR